MIDYKAAFDAFAAGYEAAFAAGYADSCARARDEREHREAEYLSYAIATDEEDIRDHLEIGHGPGQWYEDEGEWVQVPEYPEQEAARRRTEQSGARRRYDADVAAGKDHFAAALTPKPKPRDSDFSLDLLSAFATAYAIGAGNGVCNHRLLPFLFAESDLYDAAGVPPEVKTAMTAAHEAAKTSVLSWRLSDEAKAEEEQKAAESSEAAVEVGFISRDFPAGNEASRTYDAGYNEGYETGTEDAYKIAREAAYDAAVAACDGNTDVAKQVVDAISEAPVRIARESRRRYIDSLKPGSALRILEEQVDGLQLSYQDTRRPSPRAVHLSSRRR